MTDTPDHVAILAGDDILTPGDICRTLPTRPSATTVSRWMSKGCRGHKLKSVRIGSKLVTRRAWLLAFLEELSRTPAPAVTRPSRSAAPSVEAAEAELAADGL